MQPFNSTFNMVEAFTNLDTVTLLSNDGIKVEVKSKAVELSEILHTAVYECEMCCEGNILEIIKVALIQILLCRWAT
jgi:hypothetical protein